MLFKMVYKIFDRIKNKNLLFLLFLRYFDMEKVEFWSGLRCLKVWLESCVI